MELLKLYNIVTNDEDNSAEIDMYGEVVSTRPIDWLGEPLPGNYIALDDFLRDLDELRNRSRITIHINSVGGELYAGIAIYNRLRALGAEIITENDGLAASAGSIIFQAGDVRRVNAGSVVMIHAATIGLGGYYNVQDLKKIIKNLDAGNKAAINIYVNSTGRDAESIRALFLAETWMTGEEAVEKGFADEVIDTGEPVEMAITEDRAFIVANGVRFNAMGLTHIPSNIEVIPAINVIQNRVSQTAPAPLVDKNSNTERSTENSMDIKNLDELRVAFPDLLAQAETAARDEGRSAGVAEERARIQGIEAIENAIQDRTLVDNAKYGDNPMTAEQLAFQAMRQEAVIRANALKDMAQDANDSGAEDVGAAPNDGPETDNDPVDIEGKIKNIVDTYNEVIKGGTK